MLENDIEMVENAVARSAPGSKLWDAWNRIKKELSGSGQNSAALSNYEICVSCMDQPAMLCLACAKKSALPSGETNTSSPKLPGLEEFIKEAKRFQSEGDKLGGLTLIDIIEHLHDFVVRKIGRKQ